MSDKRLPPTVPVTHRRTRAARIETLVGGLFAAIVGFVAVGGLVAAVIGVGVMMPLGFSDLSGGVALATVLSVGGIAGSAVAWKLVRQAVDNIRERFELHPDRMERHFAGRVQVFDYADISALRRVENGVGGVELRLETVDGRRLKVTQTDGFTTHDLVRDLERLSAGRLSDRDRLAVKHGDVVEFRDLWGRAMFLLVPAVASVAGGACLAVMGWTTAASGELTKGWRPALLGAVLFFSGVVAIPLLLRTVRCRGITVSAAGVQQLNRTHEPPVPWTAVTRVVVEHDGTRLETKSGDPIWIGRTVGNYTALGELLRGFLKPDVPWVYVGTGTNTIR
jgi:hypothetical protein